MLAKIRRMRFREHLSFHEISRRTGLARNTIKSWLRKAEVSEPRYPKREVATKLDFWTSVMSTTTMSSMIALEAPHGEHHNPEY